MRYRLITALALTFVSVAGALTTTADAHVPASAPVSRSAPVVAGPPATAAVGYSKSACAPLKAALMRGYARLPAGVAHDLAYRIAWRETACGQGLTGQGGAPRGCHQDSDDKTCSRWALNFHPRVMGRNAWVRVCGVPDSRWTHLRHLDTDAACTAAIYRLRGMRPWSTR